MKDFSVPFRNQGSFTSREVAYVFLIFDLPPDSGGRNEIGIGIRQDPYFLQGDVHARLTPYDHSSLKNAMVNTSHNRPNTKVRSPP